jgi:hypothetical protein
MDINEFIQRVQPRKKRSRLIPFADQIWTLKTQGYTDLQIRDWLAENSVEVSRETVRKFIKKAAKTGNAKQASNTTAKSAITFNENTESETSVPVEKNGSSQAEKIRRMVEDQKRDADNKRFKHDKTGNT